MASLFVHRTVHSAQFWDEEGKQRISSDVSGNVEIKTIA